MNVIVGVSRIPGSGKGLFATADIKRGESIVQVVGPRYTAEEILDIERDEYLLETEDGTGDCIDVQGPAMYVNDARGITRINGVGNNSIFRSSDDGTMWVEATRDIKAHQEIFVSYGKYYWDVVKERIAEQRVLACK